MTFSEPNSPAETFPERYQIRHLIASGGSGDAYLAWDSCLCRDIVIKRVRTDSVDEDVVQWIYAEAGKMAALRHPNIVAVYDVALSEGTPCIVMEHVVGQTLDERISASGPLRLETFMELARQTLDALFTAHQTGMIHRDLKPSNVMITDLPSGLIQSKLLDFGLAKFIDVQAPSPQTVSIDGTIHGTTHYISPEQLRREPVGIYSDLYSLGCTFYFALTGHPPFGGSNVSEVIMSHLSHLVPPPSKLRPGIPAGISDWLMHMIERHPTDRFSDALAALQALREAAIADRILGITTHAIPIKLGTSLIPVTETRKITPTAEPSRRGRRLLLFSSGLAAILLVGALVAET
jgi:serine/threonine protein kinase